MRICGPCVCSWVSISPPKSESLMTSPGNDNFPWQHQTHNGLVLWAQNHRQAFCELKPSLSVMPLGLYLSLYFLPDLWEPLSNWTDGTDGRQVLGTSKALLLLRFLPEYTADELWSMFSQGNPTTPILARNINICWWTPNIEAMYTTEGQNSCLSLLNALWMPHMELLYLMPIFHFALSLLLCPVLLFP